MFCHFIIFEYFIFILQVLAHVGLLVQSSGGLQWCAREPFVVEILFCITITLLMFSMLISIPVLVFWIRSIIKLKIFASPGIGKGVNQGNIWRPYQPQTGEAGSTFEEDMRAQRGMPGTSQNSFPNDNYFAKKDYKLCSKYQQSIIGNFHL